MIYDCNDFHATSVLQALLPPLQAGKLLGGFPLPMAINACANANLHLVTSHVSASKPSLSAWLSTRAGSRPWGGRHCKSPTTEVPAQQALVHKQHIAILPSSHKHNNNSAVLPTIQQCFQRKRLCSTPVQHSLLLLAHSAPGLAIQAASLCLGAFEGAVAVDILLWHLWLC